MSIILYTGGIRSGKSKCAEERALRHEGTRLYVATAVVTDDEMAKRISLHKERRMGLFDTMEEPLDLTNALTTSHTLVIVDCLTFWYNNLFYYLSNEKQRYEKVEGFLCALKDTKKEVILVTNEVGWSIVPENALARAYVDFAGKSNQLIQQICTDVFCVISGIEVKIK